MARLSLPVLCLPPKANPIPLLPSSDYMLSRASTLGPHFPWWLSLLSEVGISLAYLAIYGLQLLLTHLPEISV